MKKNTVISTVLYAIAEELVKKAMDGMPKLREGEEIQKEWYENGVYYRETSFDGKTCLSQYDFRQNKVSFLEAS